MKHTLFVLLLAASAAAQNRIVSTAPAITETLYALGLGDRVIGVSTYCHYPPEVTKKPKVGTYLRPNIEQIVRMRPDLVILERPTETAIEQFRASGVAFRQVYTGDVKANLQLMMDIATAANVPGKGTALKAQVTAELERIRQLAAKRPKRGVIFLVGRNPGRLEGLIAVGKGSFLNELIAVAGGENVLAGSAVSYPKVSLETIIRTKPAVIIDMGEMADTVGVTEERKRAVEALWRSVPEIHAAVHAVASDIFVVPGPRMAEAARELYRLMHGGDAR